MPSIRKSLGLIFVVVNPACLAAQTARPDDALHSRSGPPSVSRSLSVGQNAGFSLGQVAASTPRGPYVDSLPEGKGPGRTSLRTASDALPASYVAALPSGNRPSSSGRPAQPTGAARAAVPLSPRGRETPLPLAPPGHSNRDPQGRTGGLPSPVTVAGSLAVVLGIFFLVAWGLRRAAPAGSTVLPGEVFEVLGRAPMASRQQVHLLRCGTKLLLVSVTPAGAETLTEITDPAEVDRLAGLCREAHPNSATAAFRQVLAQFAPQRSTTGLLGDRDRDDVRPTGSAPAGPE